jgi:tetratricopeptide (TPR) repeat protein
VIPEGLVRIHTILEDGYLNGRSKDAPFNFELVTGAAVRLDEGRESGTSALGLSEWIPASHVGVYLADTLSAAGEMHGNNGRECASSGAYDGLGLYAASCINTLVFGYLIAEGDFYMIERLLDAAVRLGVGDESERACSNWGIAKYRNGDLQGALQKFEETLSMNAETSVLDEVYYYLAIIHEELGNTAEAKRNRQLCDQAGGYEPSNFQVKSQGKLNKANPGLTKLNPGLGTNLSSNSQPDSGNNFCSSCGNKYPDADGKFCSSCGKARN